MYNRHALIVGKPVIGEGVWIGTFCVIDALHNTLTIGRGTNIADGAHIFTHSTVKRCISERMYGDIDTAPTEIGEYCFIGTNAVILMGVKVGHHSVIGAGAVVRENEIIPPYSIVAGVPARVVGSSRRLLKGTGRVSLSIVIPAYNEEHNLEIVIKDALHEIAKILKNYEIVIVDDGSTDKTGKIADSLSSKNQNIRVIHHKTNRGFTGAILSCYREARNDLIFLSPADGQFKFHDLNRFVQAIRGYDIAIGYRLNGIESLIRKMNSKLFHILCRILFRIKFKEISSVIMWRKRVLASLDVESTMDSAMIEPELIYKAMKKRYKFIEVPYHYYPRISGEPKGSKLRMITRTFTGMLRFWWKYQVRVNPHQ